MSKSASEITRILSASFTFGDKVINLVEDTHKSVLIGLMNILQSHAGNSDAENARETVSEFISDVKVSEFKQYQIVVTDQVKTCTATGETLINLINAWGLVATTWNVSRGGKRQVSKVAPAKLGKLS